MKKAFLSFLLLALPFSAHASAASIKAYAAIQYPDNTSGAILPVNLRNVNDYFVDNFSTISYTGAISTSFPVTTTSYVSASTYYGDGSHLTGISGGGGSASPSAPVGSIQYNSAGLFAGSSNLTVSSTSPFVVLLNGQLVPTTISATGLTSLTGLYGTSGLFGGNVASTTSVVTLRQVNTNSSSNGYGLENPTGQTTFRWWIDATGTGGNIQMSRNAATNYFTMNATGIGIGVTASVPLTVSGTISSTALATGLVTAPNISATTLLTAATASATVLNAQTASITNLTVTGVFSGTVVTYTTNVTNVFTVTTTLGTLDEATVSQTASGVTSLTTISATVFNLTLTGNTSISLIGTPVANYSRGVNIFTKQGGSTGLYALGWNIPCKWSAGYTPSPTTGIGAMDDWYVVTFDQGTSYHCYQNGAGMQ